LRKYFPLLLVLLLTTISLAPAITVEAEEIDPIGYKIYGDVVEIWNPDATYFFNKTSGIQWTEDPEQYWSQNIFALGYYSGGEWHKIYRADELGIFKREIDSDYLTYVNATLWKDFNYAGYDLRLGIRYHLKLNDTELSIIIYAKNIGAEDYPYELGFAWVVTNIDIPSSRGEDTIFINETNYRLDGVYDLTFKNMSHTYFDPELNETVIEFDPHYKMFDFRKYITLKWDGGIDYRVMLWCNGILREARVTWMVNASIFKAGQEKSTTLYWKDPSPPTVTTLSATLVEETTANPRGQVTATGGQNPTRYIQYGTSTGFYIEGTYIDVWEAVAANGAPYTITTDGANIWILDYTVEAVYKYNMAGGYLGVWNLHASNTDPNGIATDGNYIWVTDSGDAGVFKYSMAGGYAGFWYTRKSPNNEDPVGITTDGTYIWIVEGSIDVPATLQRIYKYNMAGGYLGVWSPTATNSDPWDITTDGNYIWITDYTDDVVYKYNMAGGYLGTWSPTAANDDTWGITTDGNYIWIVNTDNDAVYKYVYLATPVEKNCGVGGTGIYNSYLTGLTPGEKYYYRAKAVNTGGTGFGSEMTFFTKPNAPSSLNAYSPTDTQISLSWTKGIGAYYTYVIRKVGSYPANIGDGVQVYANTG